MKVVEPLEDKEIQSETPVRTTCYARDEEDDTLSIFPNMLGRVLSRDGNVCEVLFHSARIRRAGKESDGVRVTAKVHVRNITKVRIAVYT